MGATLRARVQQLIYIYIYICYAVEIDVSKLYTRSVINFFPALHLIALFDMFEH